MKVLKMGALGGAVMLAASLAPAPAVHAQDRDTRGTLLRAFDLGRGARIGASVDTSDAGDGKDAKPGVSIETVEPGGPADKAGIKGGDTVTEFDGERVRSVRQFLRLVQESTPGRSVPVVLSRGGQRVSVNVTPESSSFGDDFNLRLLETPTARLARPTPMPPSPPAAPRAPRAPSLISPAAPFELFGRVRTGRLGVTMEDLDSQLAEYFGVKEGVLVKSVTQDSPASKSGLKAGDVITAINGRHVYDSSDITRALDRVEADGEITLEVMRDRKTQTLKGKLETRDARPRFRTVF
jgi:serine protease Do